jgi:hypothetical protein
LTAIADDKPSKYRRAEGTISSFVRALLACERCNFIFDKAICRSCGHRANHTLAEIPEKLPQNFRNLEMNSPVKLVFRLGLK